MPKHPTTPPIYIRTPTLDDSAEFLASLKSPNTRQFFRNVGMPPSNPAAYKKYIARISTDRHEGFFVCHKKTHQILGVINLNEIVRGVFQSTFLGYYILPQHTGHGYLTQGLRLVARRAFSQLKLHRLEANIMPDNKPSLAVVKRCAFHYEGLARRYLKMVGRWRDHKRFALIREDWLQHRCNPGKIA